MCRTWLCVRFKRLFRSCVLWLLIGFSAAVFMAVDMLGRLNAVMGERKAVRGKKSQ